MSALSLTYRGDTGLAVDMSALLPERLAALTAGAIAQMPLPCGGGSARLGDLFDLSAGDAAEGLLIRPGDAILHRVGAGMTMGRILVAGDAGNHAGAGMAGGLLRIDGTAGDSLGGVLPGLPLGMRGGLISVGGDAGDREGERMRRGIVVVDGPAGAYSAANRFSSIPNQVVLSGVMGVLFPAFSAMMHDRARRGTGGARAARTRRGPVAAAPASLSSSPP